MLAILAFVAFIVGLILRVSGGGSGHLADPWVWAFLGLALLTLHLLVPLIPWRRG